MSEKEKKQTQNGACGEPEDACCEERAPSEQTGQEQDGQPQEQESASETEKTGEQHLQEQFAKLNDQFLRTCAEYDNFRKRSVKEKQAVYPQATAAAVAEFVPIIDNFERALAAPCADEEFKKGVSMIFQSFQDAVHKLGVEDFGNVGDVFDPNMHNAVMHIEDDAQEANTIVEVFQKGYKLGERIIRHAMVKVVN